LEALRASGAELGRPTFLAIFADVCDKLARPDEGLAAVAEGLALGERTGLHHWDAELRRLKGTLLLRRPGRRKRTSTDTDAESCFLEAIDIARRQQAKSFELRAAMSLSTLWHRQGKTRPAYALLSEIYGWFTEGFATPDLIDARALLDELDGRR
jgi:adenylate cyclase